MPKTRIINAYILREVLENFGVCLLIFSFAVLMTRVFKLTELVLNKGVSTWEILKVIGYLVPSFMIFVIPMSLLFGILLALGRLSSDGEIVALKVSGISLTQIFKPILVVSVIAFLATNLFATQLSPWARHAFRRLIFDITKTKAEIAIKERIFISDFEGMVLYVDRIPPQSRQMQGVLISDMRESRYPSTIISKYGYLIPNPQSLEVTLHLENGAIHRLNRKTKGYQKIDFMTYDLNLDLPDSPTPSSGLDKEKSEMSIRELMSVIRNPQTSKKYYSYLVEINSRFAIPFACLIFGFLAPPLGLHSPRSGKSYGFIISLGIIFVYYIFFSLGKDFGSVGIIHPFLAMWLPNLIFLGLAFYLFRKAKAESGLAALEKFAWYLETLQVWLRLRMSGAKPKEPESLDLPLNLNTVTLEELILRLGIEERKAAAIIAYRDEHGGFKQVEELRKIRGIGAKTLEKIEGNIYV